MPFCVCNPSHGRRLLRVIGIRYSALSDEKREAVIGGASIRRPDRHWEMCCASSRVDERWRTDGADTSMRAALERIRRTNFAYPRSTRGAIRRELIPFPLAIAQARARPRAHLRLPQRSSARSLQAIFAGQRQREGGDASAPERDELRTAAIEREYRAKLDDLKHNYALKVSVTGFRDDSPCSVERFTFSSRRRRKGRLPWTGMCRRAR